MAADTKHEVVNRFQPTDGSMNIWRYIDLPKLITFLETRSLYFARADTLCDRYEGAWTLTNIAAREQEIKKLAAKAKVNQPLEVLRQQFISSTHLGRETTYINCWHSGEAESAAMWRLYGTSAGSVVLQSSYEKLVKTLPDDAYMGETHIGNVYIGMVQYKDYNSIGDWIPGGNIMHPFIHKRKEFEHEQEVRAFIWTMEGFSKKRREKGGYKPLGIKVDIDIEQLVETIRVQPTSPDWTRYAIERLLAKYGLSTKVMPSQIDLDPLY